MRSEIKQQLVREKLVYQREKIDGLLKFVEDNSCLQSLQEIRKSFDLRDNTLKDQIAVNGELIDHVILPLLGLIEDSPVLLTNAELKKEYLYVLTNIPFTLTQIGRAAEADIYVKKADKILREEYLAEIDFTRLNGLLRISPIGQSKYEDLYKEDIIEQRPLEKQGQDKTQFWGDEEETPLNKSEKQEIIAILVQIANKLEEISISPRMDSEGEFYEDPGFDVIEAFIANLYSASMRFAYEGRRASTEEQVQMKLGLILSGYYAEIRKSNNIEPNHIFLESLFEIRGVNYVLFDRAREQLDLLPRYIGHNALKEQGKELILKINANLMAVKESYKGILLDATPYHDQYAVKGKKLVARVIVNKESIVTILGGNAKIAAIDNDLIKLTELKGKICKEEQLPHYVALTKSEKYKDQVERYKIVMNHLLESEVVNAESLNRVQKFVNSIVEFICNSAANLAKDYVDQDLLISLSEDLARFLLACDNVKPVADSVPLGLSRVLFLYQNFVDRAETSYENLIKETGFDHTGSRKDFPLIFAYKLQLKIYNLIHAEGDLPDEAVEIEKKLKALEEEKSLYELITDISHFTAQFQRQGLANIRQDDLQKFCALYMNRIDIFAESHSKLGDIGEAIRKGFENWLVKQVGIARGLVSGKTSIADIVTGAGLDKAQEHLAGRLLSISNVLKVASLIPIASEIAGALSLGKDVYQAYAEPLDAKSDLKHSFALNPDNLREGLRKIMSFATEMECYIRWKNKEVGIDDDDLSQEAIQHFVAHLLNDELGKISIVGEDRSNIFSQASARIKAYLNPSREIEELSQDLEQKQDAIENSRDLDCLEKGGYEYKDPLARAMIGVLEAKNTQSYGQMYFGSFDKMRQLVDKVKNISVSKSSGLREQTNLPHADTYTSKDDTHRGTILNSEAQGLNI